MSVTVKVLDHNTDEEIGTTEVTSVSQLQAIASVDWRPIMIGDEERSFRFHGYKWEREGNEIVAVLWVSEGN